MIEMAMPALAPEETPLDFEVAASGDVDVADAGAAVGFEEVSGILLVCIDDRLFEGLVDGEELASPECVVVAARLDTDTGMAAVMDWA